MCTLPEPLIAALSLRSCSGTVPSDIERTLKTLPILATKPAASGVRFANLGAPRNAWRGSAAPAMTEDGFQVVGGRKRDYRSGVAAGLHRSTHSAASLASMDSAGSDGPASTESGPARFSSAAAKTGDVEDRMLTRIKGKINKIGPSTYDATKVFMQQILSSDETEFLDEILKFVFQKAATEPVFCALYAQLLHELADEFTHIRVVIQRIFASYLNIFSEVAPVAVSEGTSEYKAFVETQERKKFRRGYSQFVAELTKQREVSVEEFRTLCFKIVEALDVLYKSAENVSLSEEYMDCLAKLCSNASDILRTADWSPEIVSRLSALSSKPKSEVPGFSNKARFALMDLVDLSKRGWA